MSEFREAAEAFVVEFIRYVDKYDINDEYNKKTNKMERSPGVQSLIDQARKVFPEQVDDGKTETDKLSVVQVDEAIANSPNVIDTRDMFSRKIQENGGVRRLLEEVLNGSEEARLQAVEFFRAERGEKEFGKSE